MAHAHDKRYVPWMVSIMDSKSFPDDVKILNWNYDFQVQLASAQHGSGIEEIEHEGTGFIYGRGIVNHFPNLEPAFKIMINYH